MKAPSSQALLPRFFDEEKQLALEGLLAKYSAEYRLEGLNYIRAKGERTRVFRIGIDSICGKARR